jgi:exodeoxyribonuclease-5
MACQYFVGGRWVSENEFKALLNEGLLDTLVANGKLSLTGFKKDSAKVKVADKKIIERTTIPAIKLAEILAQEIKTRQGYAPNMLSALELTEDKQNFKIPLWASPYADKFESLLTSLVTNKVVKQKFAGNSYVLGSEEGIKQGDAATGYLKDSAIVFTSKFDATKGLQPLRIDPTTGKMLPAQIMIPFKFRNERGEILSIEEFMTVDEDGRKILDTTKVPEKLLQLFGFRIPTQSRNSMAAVEIVGFLPEAMGDLILAPRDFTKQMGSDFDVDKLYTYMYNHFYQNGKLYTNFLSDPKKIEAQLKVAKESLKDLQANLNLSKEDNKIINDYIKNTVDSNEEKDDVDSVLAQQANEIISKLVNLPEMQNNMKMLIDRISVLNRSYVASKQNKILDIHLDIMTSTNPDVIASIIALDGSGEFTDLAAQVSKIRSEKGANPVPITILSDIYQRTKYINATAGKDGVGAFSLDSTLNASAQGKDLVYQNLDAESYEGLFGTPMNPRTPTPQELMEANMPIATFGEFVSKGDMSSPYTLKSQALINKAKAEKRELTKEEKESLKFKSAIIRTLQSTAVDNEKEQILDKLNINVDTFSAIRAMVIFGFEEADIAGLITQDIIWEYLDRVKANRSTTSKYNANFQAELMEELTKKYDPENKLKDASESQRLAYEKLGDMSGEQLIENLKDSKFNPTKSTDYNIGQLMILDKFIKLDGIGSEIKKIQSAINTASRGVPKSLLETNTKVTQIENLSLSNVFNAGNLLGTIEDGELSPNTISGYASKYGTMFANQIYSSYFPYNTDGFQKTFKEILKHIPSGDKVFGSSTKLAEVQNDIFQDIKSYFYSNDGSSLFLGNPDEERARLFIDKEGANKSLATILQELSSQPWYQNNQFLNKLTFDFNSNGDVSRINFESSNAANFDERSIYAGFAYLLSKNVPLGNFNGIDYTTRLLAQDLITAAFLEGGIQGSKQYLRYIPIGYLKTLGFGNYLQGIPFEFDNTFGGIMDDLGNPIYTMPSNFTRQYLQNNPSLVKTVTLGDLKGSVKVLPQSFELDKEALERNFVNVVDPSSGDMTETQTHFLTIRDDNKNNKSKYALYEFDESTRKYNRIPVLQGAYGFTQYNSQYNNVTPVYQPKIKDNKPSVVAPGTTIQGVPVKPTKTFNPNVVNNTTKQTPPNQLGVDTNMSGKRALDDLIDRLLSDKTISTTNRLLLEKLHGLTFPDKFKFEFSKQAGLKGRYNNNGLLEINLNHKNHKTANDIATTLAHELIHTFTVDSIYAYQNGELDKLSAEQINIMDNLKALHMSYINYLTNTGATQELENFIKNYEVWAKSDPATRTSFTNEAEKSKLYGAIKLTEFVTMALTDPGFQAWLNKVQVEDKSMMAKLKDLLLQLLNSFGIDIKPGTALASAVKETIDLIDSTQRKEIEGGIFFEPAPGLTSNIITKPSSTTINIYAGTGENAELSNFADRLTGYYEIDGFTEIQGIFRTVEGAFQAAKIKYTKNLSKEEIIDNALIGQKLADVSGSEAKALGRKIKGLDRVAWDADSSNIMKKILLQSFKANPDALAKLLATGNATLTHTQDKGKWGKEFPRLLMEVRDELGGNITKDAKYELFPGVYANAGQRKAIDLLKAFLEDKQPEFLLQGKGGTGKTTIIKKILEDAAKKRMRVLAVAPTHKAKKVLGKSMTGVKTATLASALAIKLDETTGKFLPDQYARDRNRVPVKNADLIIIDESSMISDKLLDELREMAERGTKIIFMGDRAQLPPVGQETDSKVFDVSNGYELTEKMRQAATSPIIGIGSKVAANVETTGQRVANPITQTDRVTQTDDVSGSSIIWEDSERVALDQFVEDIQQANGDVNYAKIVTFNNQSHSSPQSVKSLNNKVRYKLFGEDARTTQFMEGELLTAYDTFGGEDPLFFNSEDFLVKSSERVGPKEFTLKTYSAKKGERIITVTVDVTYLGLTNEDGNLLKELVPVVSQEGKAEYDKLLADLFKTDPQMAYKLKDKFANLEYGYAVTSHKAQGSTYTNVYVMEDNIMGPSNGGSIKAKNQSLYVAVSRPKTKLVMVSNKNGEAPVKGLNLGKITGGASLAEPFPSNFSDKDDQGPSPEDLDLFNRAFSDESLATREMDEDMYQKYLLICGK